MQSLVPQYLEASMDAFRKNQLQFQQAMEGAFAGGPFAEIAKRNMEMFKAAASAFRPGMPIPGMPIPGMPGEEQGGASQATSEVAELKAQLAALNAKIENLSK
jgi:polyhydroxyalkanoate synthesis regulator protein